MNFQSLDTKYISLGEAAKHISGKPSTNSIWRWARNGLLARNGERIKLGHARFGGRIYTSLALIEEFGRRLADADAAHFDKSTSYQTQQMDGGHAPRPEEDSRRLALQQMNQELDEAGL